MSFKTDFLMPTPLLLSHPTPDIYAWNCLLRSRPNPISLYLRLLRHGSRPDSFTFPILLPSLSPQLISQIHAHILLTGLFHHPHVLSSLISSYSSLPSDLFVFLSLPFLHLDLPTSNSLLSSLLRAGHLSAARQLFYQMPQRNIVSWSSLIDGHAKLGNPRAALSIFRDMLAGHSSPTPNPFTLSSVLAACASLGALHHGLWVHAFISRVCIPLNAVLATSLIDMYAKCGRIHSARQVFDEMPLENRDATAWTAMISGLSVNGLAREALNLFQSMCQRNVPANSVTLIAALQACVHGGLVGDGEQLFRKMTSEFGITPTIQHYGCMVDLYARAGLIGRAWSTVNSMPMRPDVLIWGSLLSGSRTHGDILTCEAAIKGLVELEPANSAAYVLLSNAYAKLGRRREVSSTRKLMERRGVKKTPGCSFVEVDGRIHEFFAGDLSSLEGTQLHEMVEEMMGRLRGAGFVGDTREVLLDMDGEEEGKELAMWAHNEKLAVAFVLMKTMPGTEIRVVKNLRICVDCHEAIKLVSRVYGREILVRDCNRFHHFNDGDCSCRNFW
ncbi:Pentatricopeptide repeat-containing protein [Apostasia shenzhenica]|uniref:Pentatricopeptide repeat-containing protein n=1 Tax=Apostasia shenzhenica TaxID=1088818 RepID=A0A2I0B377_9ASPA|nr:Pentatricopeptide repeat-containing protein [Apostasia shenzhenica]